MREIRSYGSVGEQGGNELLYPESAQRCLGLALFHTKVNAAYGALVFHKLTIFIFYYKTNSFIQPKR